MDAAAVLQGSVISFRESIIPGAGRGEGIVEIPARWQVSSSYPHSTRATPLLYLFDMYGRRPPLWPMRKEESSRFALPNMDGERDLPVLLCHRCR